MKSYRESGEGKFQFIVWLLIFIGVGMAAFEWVPQRIAVAELEDYMVESAQRAHQATPKQLKANILYKAEQLGLPLEKDKVQVSKKQGIIKIDAEYVVVLEFPFYTHTWNVNHNLERSFFII